MDIEQNVCLRVLDDIRYIEELLMVLMENLFDEDVYVLLNDICENYL